MKRSGLITLTFLLLGGLVTAAPAFANPALIARQLLTKFEAPVGRYVLGTEAGRDVLRMMGATDARGLSRTLARSESAVLRQELERQIDRIQSKIDDFRNLKRQNGVDPGPVNALTRRERYLVRMMTERFLRIRDPSWVVNRLTPQDLALFSAGATGGLDDTARFFMESREAAESVVRLRAPVEAAASAATPVRESLIRRLGNFFRRADECLASQNAGQERSDFIFYTLQGMGVTAALTTGGHVLASGVEDVDISDLSTDVITALTATAVSSWIMRGHTTWKVRWIRIMAFGTGRVAVDGVIYYFDPVDAVTGASPIVGHTWEDTLEREKFGMMWNVGNSPKNIALYYAVRGLMCLHPGSTAVKWGTTAIRTVDSVGSTALFFELRKRYLDQDE